MNERKKIAKKNLKVIEHSCRVLRGKYIWRDNDIEHLSHVTTYGRLPLTSTRRRRTKKERKEENAEEDEEKDEGGAGAGQKTRIGRGG